MAFDFRSVEVHVFTLPFGQRDLRILDQQFNIVDVFLSFTNFSPKVWTFTISNPICDIEYIDFVRIELVYINHHLFSLDGLWKTVIQKTCFSCMALYNNLNAFLNECQHRYEYCTIYA